MVFRNRREAGRLLADRIVEMVKEPVDAVGFLPRGAIEIAEPIAMRLGCPVVPVFVAKLRHPFQPEYAIGAVDASGEPHYSARSHEEFIPPEQMEDSIRHARASIRHQIETFSPLTPTVRIKDSNLLLVDDGLATGESCKAALRYLKKYGPSLLVLGIPCASVSGIGNVRGSCDRIVTVAPPDPEFVAVGDYYYDFKQVEDDEVKEVMARVNREYISAREPRAA